MTLNEFITKQNIILDPKLKAFAESGVEIMSKSIDILHNEKHIERLFDTLDLLIENSTEFKKEDIDFNVLLISVCWHDTWKSERMPLNVFTVFFDQVWDGIGSMIKFTKAAKINSLDKELIKKIRYVIRKHGKIQLIQRKTLESKIMNDIDRLDEWTMDRIKPAYDKYMNKEAAKKRYYNAMKFYINFFLKRKTEKHFYFKWSKNEFKKKREYMIGELEKGLEEYRKMINF